MAAVQKPALTSINQIDLSPLPGKTYFNTNREWREEFIYFLLVDRFHDDADRIPVSGPNRSPGFKTANTFHGGTLRGIARNLDYIAGLGCTAIWLSPIFENNPNAYHGYDINNYLDVDKNFGTKKDLVDLVEAAHKRDMRIILDVVINHSGDNWEYPGGHAYRYCDRQQFPFGRWRRDDRPLPVELRNPDFYHRCGEIGLAGYDQEPEVYWGDICGLKDYANDDTPDGLALIDTLVKTHCHWIREADVDGFRVDAVKHLGALACSRFCSMVREYAFSLGKRGFFLFGEVASREDPILDRYIGQNTCKQDGDKTVFFGLNSVLDFRLANCLPGVLKGFADPSALFDRLSALQYKALTRGELGRYLVTFLDNHDSFWQPGGRFSRMAPDDQVIAGIGYLLCAIGTACIYYGTEQGLDGQGGDNEIREALFDKQAGGASLLNKDCRIYREVAKIAAVQRANSALRFGRMYFREISGNGADFGLPFGTDYTLAFSRLLFPREVLVAYNVSAQPRNDCITVDANAHPAGSQMRYLHGGTGGVTVQSANGRNFVQLPLAPHQFVILE